MAEDLEAERAHRLGVIMRSEGEITLAAREAYRRLLREIARDVLEARAVVAAVPEVNQNRNQRNQDWLALLALLFRPIRRLFKSRFLGSGARREAMQAAMDVYIARSTDQLKDVPDEVYRDLNRIVQDGIRAGLSEAEIRAALTRELTPGHAEYNQRLKTVSERIGRTEATAAFNAGEEAGWSDVAAKQGSSLSKMWLSQRDGRVRDTHIDADGQVVGADEFFDVGGYEGLYPGDRNLPASETANCRCTAVYSTKSALVASGATVTTPEETALPDGWRGPIAALDVETGDKRVLMTPADGLKTRDYPMSLTLGHVGDGEAPVIGSIDRVWGENGELYGEGKIDVGGDAGAEFARQLRDGFINSVSIHPANVTAELQLVLADGTVLTGQDAQDAYEANDYQLPEGSHDRMAMTDWVLAGLAVVPIPAYTQARIEGVYGYEPSGPQKGDAAVVMQEGIVAAVGGQVFKREFFEAVATGPTPLTVTEDGHIFGHVRLHGTCHLDYDFCVEPPLSSNGYARFHVHGARMDDGSIMPVGALTYGEGHISRGGMMASRAHYDNVATVGAKVRASDDAYGVWITGQVLESHMDKAYDLMLAPISGHWEPDPDNNNHLEMIAAHLVVTPGYRVSRIVASAADGRNVDSLITTTYPRRDEAQTVVASSAEIKALVAAAVRNHARDAARAERAAKRAGVDPQSRIARANARINPEA